MDGAWFRKCSCRSDGDMGDSVSKSEGVSAPASGAGTSGGDEIRRDKSKFSIKFLCYR